MKITLSQSHVFALAQEFAGHIHSAVVTMHLRSTWGLHPHEAGQPSCMYGNSLTANRIAEIRAALKSIKDPYERKSFVFTIGFLFKKLRAEQRTHVRWQDYYASVKAHVENSCRDKKNGAEDAPALPATGELPARSALLTVCLPSAASSSSADFSKL